MAVVRAARHLGFIDSPDDIRAGIRALRRKCAVMRRTHDLVGDPPLRRRTGGFEGLCRIVVGQQLSVASASAIWDRTQACVVPFTPSILLEVDEAKLRSAGLSRPKLLTLRAAAAAVVEGRLDLDALAEAPSEALREALLGVRGIGPWTVDIFELFCIGRRDAFAPGDLALQVAVAMAMGLDERPCTAELAEIARRWRPWRGVAARLLWSYYQHAKDARSGAPA